MDIKDLDALVDIVKQIARSECQKTLKDSNVASNYFAIVQDLNKDTTCNVTLAGGNTTYTNLINKTGETLNAGDVVLIEALNDNIGNGYIKIKQGITGTDTSAEVYTVKIDQNNFDTEACCTYADRAKGITKRSNIWDDIFGCKPCIMKDGEVIGYLMPNDFTKYEDETDAPITDANYDVMIEFPRRGLNIGTDDDGIITISLTTNLNDSNFQYLAHQNKKGVQQAFYLGAYSATGDSTKIGSNSGKSAYIDMTLNEAIANAYNRGENYGIMGFYQWMYIQALYILKYGDLNSQVALGRGYVNGTVASVNSGSCDKLGMCYGTTSDTQPMKLFGLENLWGNVEQWLSCMYCDTNYNILTTTDHYSSTAEKTWKYNVSSGLTSDTYGYITKVQGSNNGGFILKEGGGLATTYFCDVGQLVKETYPVVGGNSKEGNGAGIFFCRVYSTPSGDSSTLRGTRLMYL